MAHFVLQLLLIVFATLFSPSKANEHQCRPYYVNGVYHDGLICPQYNYNLVYCCQTIIGNDITERCCTKSEWETSDSNPAYFSTINIVLICAAGVTVIGVIVACMVLIRRRQRRRAVILGSRCAAQSTVIGVAAPAYGQTPKIGQYRQFENPPTYSTN